MSLLESLAGGLRGAAGVLSPEISRETFQADQQNAQQQNQQKLAIVQHIQSQVQAGAMQPEAGAQILLKMGAPPEIAQQLVGGPSAQAQAATRQAQDLLAYRKAQSALPPDATPEQQMAVARPYLDPQHAVTSLETHVKNKQANEGVLARLQQAAENSDRSYQMQMLRFDAAERGGANKEEIARARLVETQRHNQMSEAIQKQALSLTGQRLYYDTGLGNGIGVQTPLPSQPSGPDISNVRTNLQGGERKTLADISMIADPQLRATVLAAYRRDQGQQPQASPQQVAQADPNAMPNFSDVQAGSTGGGQGGLPAPVMGGGTESRMMPAFTGSPREIANEQNKWLQAQEKADTKVSITGGRESVFLNRILTASAQVNKDIANIIEQPISADRGIFGGRSQGKSLFEAGKESLATKMTTQDVQTYNAIATGIQRNLAAIESSGLAPSNSLMHMMDNVIFKEGDTNLTKIIKLAQTRQVVEAGLETILTNPRVPKEQKDYAEKMMKEITAAVPFTARDVMKLQSLQITNPNASLKDVMSKNNRRESDRSGLPPQSAIEAEMQRRGIK